MKTTFYIVLTALLLALPLASHNAYAQDEDALIEDVIAQLPTEKEADFDAQMKKLADIGKRAVEILAGRLAPATERRNAKIEYALNGLVAYASAEGRETLAAGVRSGLRTSIDVCADKVNKAFLMTLLQLIGTAEDASVYVKYLDDDHLKPFAISGLLALPDDGKTIPKLIKKSKTYDEGLAYLAAHKGLAYPKNSPAKSDEVAEAQAQMNSEYSHKRFNALYTLIHSGKFSPQELVLAALKDKDREYRAAALMEANDFADGNFYGQVCALYPELTDEAKADVMRWLGDNHASGQIGLVAQETKSKNAEVAKEAIKAAGKIGGTDALKALASCLEGKYGKNAVTALTSFRADVTDVVLTALNSSPKTQALALKLAGARHITAATPKVFELTGATDNAVRKAAYKALAGVCTHNDFDNLCILLDGCGEENTADVEAAITVSVQGLSEEEVAVLKKEAYTGSKPAFIALVNMQADMTADLLALAEQNAEWRDAALLRVCVLFDKYVPAKERPALIVKAMDIWPSEEVKRKLLTALGDSRDPAGIGIAVGYIDAQETAEAAAYAIKTIAGKNKKLLHDEEVRTALVKARDVYSALSATDADAGYAVDEINGLLAGATVGCGSNSEKTPELKVISYNIRLLTSADEGENAWDARKEASVNMILTEKPDVIGFQEPWLPQIDYLVENLPQYGCVKVGRETGLREDGGEHIMAMWNKEKFDLLDSGHFWLSETPEEVSKGWDAACYRVAQWLRLGEKETGKEFYFFNTHLDHKGDEARKEGAKLIVNKIKEIAGEDAAVFLTGDMNIALGSAKEELLAPYDEWMESVRATAPETDSRPTFQGFGRSNNPRIIDYIYYRNAGPLRYETLDGDGYGTKYISDHYPISGVFSL